MNYALVSCEVFHREMAAAIAASPHKVTSVYLEKGLHDLGAVPMRQLLQEAVDRAAASGPDAVLLGYGLCSLGLQGLTAGAMPLVLPRAHDCITLFLGSQDRYLKVFEEHPGTYFLTSGWIEHGEVSQNLRPLSIGHAAGMDRSYAELVEEYGEDNAEFLYETLVAGRTPHYTRLCYIEMGVEPDDRFEQEARRRAAEQGWIFEHLQGDMDLIHRLIDGPWNKEDFLVVQPGHAIRACHDGSIVASVASP